MREEEEEEKILLILSCCCCRLEKRTNYSLDMAESQKSYLEVATNQPTSRSPNDDIPPRLFHLFPATANNSNPSRARFRFFLPLISKSPFITTVAVFVVVGCFDLNKSISDFVRALLRVCQKLLPITGTHTHSHTQRKKECWWFVSEPQLNSRDIVCI